MKEAFKDWSPRDDTMNVVRMCDRIVNEYQEQGLKLTLRQLYYQFVARDLIPNTERSYKNLGNVVGKARMAGLLDWVQVQTELYLLPVKFLIPFPVTGLMNLRIPCLRFLP